MKYDKCPICELNYKPINEEICVSCARSKEGRELDNLDVECDICVYCESHRVLPDEEMCEICKAKLKKKKENSL